MNVAFPVSADSDALRQAKILVKKMKRDERISMEKHWKMITVFFGANDLCSGQCFDMLEASPISHANKLMVALDYMQDNLPRTFVNLIPVLGKNYNEAQSSNNSLILYYGVDLPKMFTSRSRWISRSRSINMKMLLFTRHYGDRPVKYMSTT